MEILKSISDNLQNYNSGTQKTRIRERKRVNKTEKFEYIIYFYYQCKNIERISSMSYRRYHNRDTIILYDV